MSDLRDKIEAYMEDVIDIEYGPGDPGIVADRIIEIMREALLTPDVFRALVVSLDTKVLEDGYIQFNAAAGMHAALDTAGVTRRKQTIEDFIEGR